LQTTNFSSLSSALSRPLFVAFVGRMVERLESAHQPGEDELVAIDGMAITLQTTQRHQCTKFNDKTVGGGVVWAYMIHAARKVCPVKVLKIVRGAWSDSTIMAGVALIANGPVYLMDRGFHCYALMQQWITDGVRLVVRLKRGILRYEILKTVRPARRCGAKYITVDAVARLGKPDAKIRPKVRLVIAKLPSGEELILASNRLAWSAERILDAYKQRWHIERFHRFLKDTLGLAHLYNFRQDGLEFQLYTALLTALLLFFGSDDFAGDTIAILRRMLKLARRVLGLGIPWKRNTVAARRTKKKPTDHPEKNH
jgi:hypothetical protein